MAKSAEKRVLARLYIQKKDLRQGGQKSMHPCEFCEASLPEQASFCGTCGKAQSRVALLSVNTPSPAESADGQAAHVQTPDASDEAVATFISTPPSDLAESPTAALSSDEANGLVATFISTPPSPDLADAPTVALSSDEAIATFISTPPSDLMDAPTAALSSDEANGLVATFISSSSQDQATALSQRPQALQKEDEEDEEERRRRALLIGLALPFAGDGGYQGAPVVQGTPHLGGAPAVQGTPPIGIGNGTPSGLPPSPPLQMSPLMLAQGSIVSYIPSGTPGVYLPSPGPLPPTSSPGGSAAPNPPSSNPTTSTSPTAGCLTWLSVLIAAIIVFISLFGVAFTFFAPTLKLNGNTTIGQGGQFHLHGGNFIPNITVTLTRDNAIPIYMAQQAQPGQAEHTLRPWMVAQQAVLAPEVSRAIKVNGQGTFDITIPVGQDWNPGQHILHASEGYTPRSASLTVTITGVALTNVTPTLTPVTKTTATITATTTATVTATTTATTTATVTQNATPSITTNTTTTMLASVSPNIVDLGPISEGNNQVATQQVTLNTTGTNLISWTASWDHNQAPWLQLDHTSGQIQAPNTQQLRLSAQATSLNAGTYKATITFTNTGGQQSVTLAVNFTVQQGCIGVSPNQLLFTGIENQTDATPQTLLLTNCGQQTGSWSSSTNDPNATWLSVSPSTGVINAGATQTVIVTASNVRTELAKGTYPLTLTFTNGGRHVSVQVTLTVLPAPQLSVSNTTINANTTCKATVQTWICFESLTNSIAPGTNANWAASSNGLTGITFTDVTGAPLASGTLTPGQTIRIQITIPIVASNCQGNPTIIFSGPGNTVTVPLSCRILPVIG